MSTNTVPNLGSYLWQNGRRILLEKEAAVITAYIYDKEKLEMVKQLEGVLNIKQVFNEVFRLKVDPNRLEFIMESLRSGIFNIVCHHAYKPTNTHNTRYYITDKITVKFRHDTSYTYIEALMEQLKLVYVRTYTHNTYLLQVTTSSSINPIKVANVLANRQEVIYAEPNLISRFLPCFTPSDNKFVEQWYLDSVPAPELKENAHIEAVQAWDITMGDRDVVIAVLDDGFDLSHPDFQGTDKIKFPKDFVDDGDDPRPRAGNYHGTPCAGVAIAEANGEGIVGAAPGCSFMPVRIPFGADPNLLYDIFDYVGRRADVISCSWGPPPVYAPLHQLVFDKIKELSETGGPRGKGCVIVFAAHNFNAPLKDLENENGVRYLAGSKIYQHHDPIWNGNATHPNVLAVAACTSLNKKAAYSNWGKQIAISAPSNNYHPLDYNIKLKGRGICTTDNFKVGDYFSPNSRYTTQFGGTSSAAPIVAGVAGLVISTNPELTAEQVKNILLTSSDKIEDTGRDVVLGHQKGIYNENGHSEWFGYGRVNAYKAVVKALEMIQAPSFVEEETPISAINGNNNNSINGNNNGNAVVLEPEPIVIKPINGVSNIKFHAHTKGSLTESDDAKIYKITIGKKLVVELNGEDTATDFDLYLKKDKRPSRDNYDARAITETSKEKIVFDSLEAGEYYIMVNSFSGGGDFDLKIHLE